ncbi:hypothetical protein EDD86DRAFT_230704 [Gorgonomyces haynaldii]|nr:hypothetical protein EDD86DRAFT_230704 [Gorgonomyces haynaldii]
MNFTRGASERTKLASEKRNEMLKAYEMLSGAPFSDASDKHHDLEDIELNIDTQLLQHYIVMGVLLVVGHFTNWLTLYPQFMAPYITFAWICYQLTRIIHRYLPTSTLPLFLSFLPQLLFCFMGRQQHFGVSAIWLASIMGMSLQLASQGSTAAAMLTFFGFICVYYLSGVGANLLWANTSFVTLLTDLQYPGGVFLPCNNNATLTCDCPSGYVQDGVRLQCRLRAYSNLARDKDLATEYTEIVVFLLLSTGYYFLAQYIRDFSTTLLERQKQANNLAAMNSSLKNELRAAKPEIEMDLDSPLTKVIKMIRSIQGTANLDLDTMESLDYVVFLLSSNELYGEKVVNATDTDVTGFLNTLVNTGKNNVPKVDLTTPIPIAGKQLQSTNPRVMQALRTVDDWSFDIFNLASASEGKPLYCLGMALFDAYDFKDSLNVDPMVMMNFLARVESGYRNVTYHNSIHAADVMHALHYFIHVLGLGELLSPAEVFACFVAAAIHDVDHPGYNNAFMIASSSPLALRYNDIAVLENHHCSTGFEIMYSDPKYNVLQGFPPEQRKELRSMITSLVLATDMANHFEYIAKFKNKINGAGIDFADPKDRQLTLDIAIKCGDINNASKSLDLCTQWASLIMNEFFLQGDEERKRGLTVSMFMDRDTTIISKCQVGFIEYIVIPLYEAWDLYMNDEGNFPAMENLRSNRDYWKSCQE